MTGLRRNRDAISFLAGTKINIIKHLRACLKLEFHLPVAVGQAINRGKCAVDGRLTVNFFTIYNA